MNCMKLGIVFAYLFLKMKYFAIIKILLTILYRLLVSVIPKDIIE